jgi:DDE superfamily endonuclease
VGRSRNAAYSQQLFSPLPHTEALRPSTYLKAGSSRARRKDIQILKLACTGFNIYLTYRRKSRRIRSLNSLIGDGFGTHESPELLRFPFENNIHLVRLGSHTSHKTQPCDVGPFGPLKTAYRQEAERLFRGGSNIVASAICIYIM